MSSAEMKVLRCKVKRRLEPQTRNLEVGSSREELNILA